MIRLKGAVCTGTGNTMFLVIHCTRLLFFTQAIFCVSSFVGRPPYIAMIGPSHALWEGRFVDIFKSIHLENLLQKTGFQMKSRVLRLEQ